MDVDRHIANPSTLCKHSDTDRHTSAAQPVASPPLPVSFPPPLSSAFPPPQASVSLPPAFVAPSPPPPAADAPLLLSWGGAKITRSLIDGAKGLIP